jgi:hypothetical protein
VGGTRCEPADAIRIGLAVAGGLALLLLGALASHRRAGDTIKETTPALAAIATVYLAVAALHA